MTQDNFDLALRLVDQRHRNRVMEALHNLTLGLNEWGAVEYFNAFYDVVDGDRPYPNHAMSPPEQAALQRVCALMNEASAATPRDVSDEILKASGWVEQIKPIAAIALDTFLERGRSDEESAEEQPSVLEGKNWTTCVGYSSSV